MWPEGSPCYQVGPFQLWGQARQLSLAIMGSALCTCCSTLFFLSLLCVDICNACAAVKESSSSPSSAAGTAGIWKDVSPTSALTSLGDGN